MREYFIFIFFSLISFVGLGQEVMFSHSSGDGLVTFSDKVNLRESPTTDSKIVATVDQGVWMQHAYETVKGIVNGKQGLWYGVKYKGTKAFVWDGLLARSAIKSQEDIDYNFLFNNKDNQTNVKIYYKGEFKKSISIANPDSLDFFTAKSLGKTWQSNGNDVLLLYYGNYDKNKLKFYTWNNQNFVEYKFPFKDSSFLNYNRRNQQLITEKLVNLRSEPNIESSVLKVLKLGSKVGLSRRKISLDTLGDDIGYWSKVFVGSDTGYIWDSYVSLYHFQSYKEKNLTFMLRESFGYRDQIIALKNDKIIDTFSFRKISNFYGAHSLGTMGLEDLQEILGVCYSGESCGVPSGDVLIAWKNNKFHKLINDYGIGDGGLSYGHYAIFPSEREGERGIIKIQESDSESITLYRSGKEENNYDGIYEFNLTRNYLYVGDKLKEIPSETNKMEGLLATNFKGYKLSYFEKGDFNKDGIQDVVIYALDTLDSGKESYYKKKNKSLIVIALGDGFWNYNVVSSSKKLVYHWDNRPLTKVEQTNKGFCVKIFYSGYYNDFPNQRHYYLYFDYNKRNKEFFLTRTTEIFPPDNYSGLWDKKEYYYSKKPIAFSNSYHPSFED